MKCPHCLDSFHHIQSAKETNVVQDRDGAWCVVSYVCPTCERATLALATRAHFNAPIDPASVQLIRPRGSQRPPCPQQVIAADPILAADYAEACLVLPDSAKASAALSRRCLQHLLHTQAKTTKRDLFDQIQEVLDSHALPSHLAENLDHVRATGNFATHPIKSTNTGEIVLVEPGEAEWNLDVLEGLFDKPRSLSSAAHRSRTTWPGDRV